jgi:hypothetical protein
MTHYRLNIRPVNDHTVAIRLEKIFAFGETGEVVSECVICRTGGTTTYTGKDNQGFRTFPKEFEDQIKAPWSMPISTAWASRRTIPGCSRTRRRRQRPSPAALSTPLGEKAMTEEGKFYWLKLAGTANPPYYYGELASGKRQNVQKPSLALAYKGGPGLDAEIDKTNAKLKAEYEKAMAAYTGEDFKPWLRQYEPVEVECYSEFAGFRKFRLKKPKKARKR